MIALIIRFLCRIGFSMPKIVDDSLFIIYTTAVGLSMFASGLSLTLTEFGNAFILALLIKPLFTQFLF